MPFLSSPEFGNFRRRSRSMMHLHSILMPKKGASPCECLGSPACLSSFRFVEGESIFCTFRDDRLKLAAKMDQTAKESKPKKRFAVVLLEVRS